MVRAELRRCRRSAITEAFAISSGQAAGTSALSSRSQFRTASVKGVASDSMHEGSVTEASTTTPPASALLDQFSDRDAVEPDVLTLAKLSELVDHGADFGTRTVGGHQPRGGHAVLGGRNRLTVGHLIEEPGTNGTSPRRRRRSSLVTPIRLVRGWSHHRHLSRQARRIAARTRYGVGHHAHGSRLDTAWCAGRTGLA